MKRVIIYKYSLAPNDSKLLTNEKTSFAEVQLLYLCFLHHNIYFRYFTHKHVREIANTKTDLVRWSNETCECTKERNFDNLTLPQKARVTKLNVTRI